MLLAHSSIRVCMKCAADSEDDLKSTQQAHSVSSMTMAFVATMPSVTFMPSVTMILGIMPVSAAVVPWSVVAAVTFAVLVPFAVAFTAVAIVTFTVLWHRGEKLKVSRSGHNGD
uniref:Uncharacterized protein n=1 Tax=Noctiluca scintillans TaxID=2966 RepID=A0A7S1EY47_NOCSC